MRTQDIEIVLTSQEENLLSRLHFCSQVIHVMEDNLAESVIGRVLDIITVANKVLATVEFTVPDRVLARMLGVPRTNVDSYLETAEYSLAVHGHSQALAITVESYQPDELDIMNFDDEGWPK